MAKRTRNRTILTKIESTPGTDASPVVGTDAVRVESPQYRGNIEAVETDEVRSGLDRSNPVPGGGNASLEFGVNLKGSGTGGTEPEWAPSLRGSGFGVTTIGTAVTGTAQSGSDSTIVLAVGDGANVTEGALVTTTGGTGSGQTRVIKSISTDTCTVAPDWDTAPDNTTTYSVGACNVYAPASTGLKNLSIYDYMHDSDSAVNSKLRKILGAMGNVGFTLPTRGIVQAAFQFTGVFVKPSDVSAPAAPTLDTQRPVVLQAADSYLGGQVAKFNQITLDMGNVVAQADNPAATYGFDPADITDRSITGRINPLVALTSARDTWTDFLAGTSRDLWVNYGSAGNGISFLIPDLKYTGSEDEDINAIAHEGIPFASRNLDGGIYLCVY